MNLLKPMSERICPFECQLKASQWSIEWPLIFCFFFFVSRPLSLPLVFCLLSPPAQSSLIPFLHLLFSFPRIFSGFFHLFYHLVLSLSRFHLDCLLFIDILDWMKTPNVVRAEHLLCYHSRRLQLFKVLCILNDLLVWYHHVKFVFVAFLNALLELYANRVH